MGYSKLTEKHSTQLMKIVGQGGYEYGGDLSAYNNNYRPVDGIIGGKSKLVLLPSSSEEVSEILKYCNKHKIKVFTQGGNTGLSGGSTPDDSGDGIILRVERRMNRILSPLNEDVFSAKLQGGVILDILNEEAMKYGSFCSIKHGGTGSSTIGGNVATNSGGVNACKYGVTRDQVIGLTVVLADGEIMKLGGSLKDTAGLDLKNLFIGSEGMLGVITEVEIKLHKTPLKKETVFFSLDNYEAVSRLGSRILKEFGRGNIEAFELMNKKAFNLGISATNGADTLQISRDKKLYIICEVSSNSPAEDLQGRLVDFLERNKELFDFDNSLALDGYQRDMFWKIREHCTDGSNKYAGKYAIRYDNCVPLDSLGELVYGTDEVIKKELSGNKYIYQVVFGHALDGNLHQHIIQDKNKIAESGVNILDHKKDVDKAIYDSVMKLGGSTSAEHSIGRLLQRLLCYPEKQIELMVKIKEQFDPNNIMNPGIGLPI